MTCRLRIALLVVALGGFASASAQTGDFELRKVEQVHLDDVDAGVGGERVVELYVRALTRYGEPVGELHAAHFVIRDNDEKIDDDDKTVQTVAQAGRGMSSVIAVDTSRTMQGEPFNRARAAALEFLAKLEPRDRVAVVAFSDDVRVVVPFGASRQQAQIGLEQLDVDSESLSTALYDGVHKAVRLLREGKDLPRRSFVIVFSDGKDAGSQSSLAQVVQDAKPSQVKPPALIFSIGYARFGREGFDVLRQLSEETGGEFLHAESTIHLSSFFNGIWKQMKESYVVRYPGDMDGESHTVEVEVEGRSDSRSATYPDIPGPWWPYLAVLAVAVLMGLAALLIARGRAAGRLVFASGPRAGEAFVVKGAKLRIGALPDNDVVIDSNTVSRYHAAIHCKRGQVEIEDLNSSNGTFVNGTAIRTSPLLPGDKIRIADVDLVFER